MLSGTAPVRRGTEGGFDDPKFAADSVQPNGGIPCWLKQSEHPRDSPPPVHLDRPASAAMPFGTGLHGSVTDSAAGKFPHPRLAIQFGPPPLPPFARRRRFAYANRTLRCRNTEEAMSGPVRTIRRLKSAEERLDGRGATANVGNLEPARENRDRLGQIKSVFLSRNFSMQMYSGCIRPV